MDKATEFLKNAHLYHLGDLDTEKPHPKTVHLSDWAKNDLKKAISVLTEVDGDALKILASKCAEIIQLRSEIQSTWNSGGRVFLIGCGATGRLSLTLENIYREMNPDATEEVKSRVVALMAGGDVALVHSLEGFEDFADYGRRHLQDLGFCKGDLLLAITEGGETPYVIGGVEYAATISRSPYFLYCNPDAILKAKVERSRRVLENDKIKKINLAVGPMAVTGSTRMQASTVLQLAAGLALLTDFSEQEMQSYLRLLGDVHSQNATDFLPGFIEGESLEYQEGRYVIYEAHNYAITIFTDTTERAPTFSLTSFSHKKAAKLLKLRPSLSYVCLPEAKTAAMAWQKLLSRSPRALNWLEVDERTSMEYLEAFDFGLGALKFREEITQGVEHNPFVIKKENGDLSWQFMGHQQRLILPELASGQLLFEHSLLKMLLNIHSTLVMGRLGRYEENLMTFVFPTNGKLIDRATRYVQILLARRGKNPSYEEIVREIFRQQEGLQSGAAVVLKTMEKF